MDKFCPYCGFKHSERGKYCCKGHAKRAAGQLAAASMGRTRARKRVMEVVHGKALNKQRWRDVAMGRDVQLNLAAIFEPRQVATRWRTDTGWQAVDGRKRPPAY